MLTRVGPGKPAAMRNSPPQAALWTDGNRSAPYLAVFDGLIAVEAIELRVIFFSCRSTYISTGGLGASSSVALASLSGALSSTDVSLLPDILFSTPHEMPSQLRMKI